MLWRRTASGALSAPRAVINTIRTRRASQVGQVSVRRIDFDAFVAHTQESNVNVFQFSPVYVRGAAP